MSEKIIKKQTIRIEEKENKEIKKISYRFKFIISRICNKINKGRYEK